MRATGVPLVPFVTSCERLQSKHMRGTPEIATSALAEAGYDRNASGRA